MSKKTGTNDTKLPFHKHFLMTVASSPGAIWVTSNDHDDTLRTMAQVCKGTAEKPLFWNMWIWSASEGLVGPTELAKEEEQPADHFAAAKQSGSQLAARMTAVDAIKLLKNYKNSDNDPSGEDSDKLIPTILVLQDLDLCWADPQEAKRIVSAIRLFIVHGKINKKTIVGLSHLGGQVTDKLAPLFVPVPYGLPDMDSLRTLLNERMQLTALTVKPTVDEQRQILEAGKGLTLLQFDNALCESLLRYKGRFNPNYIWDFKVSLFNQEGLVEVYRGSKGFESIGGQIGLKRIGERLVNYMLKKPGVQLVEGVEPLGLLLAGAPGTGKTLFATCLGFETGLHTLLFDMGKCFGMWMGESEAKMDRALALFEAHAPAIVVIDEIGRMINSDGGKSAHSGGTESRVVGKFLTWLSSEKRRGLFIIGTTNDASGIQTLCRSGRFDMNVYTPLNIPKAQKDAIWDIYIKKFQISDKNSADRPNDENMTPAEIEQVCKNAMMFGMTLVAAADTITRVKETMAVELQNLEEWGQRYLISSESGKRFAAEETKPIKKMRRPVPVSLDDDDND